MLVSTFLNLAITPVLYVIIKSLELRGGRAQRNGAPVRDGIVADGQAPVTPTAH